MKYTGKYFRDNLPDWKRKKDPLLVRFWARPISFYLAAFAANHGISANTVSYTSSIVAIAGCLCFLAGRQSFAILGAVLFNIWLIMDCIDGNLARSVKKQPFGEFADAMSSYILVGFMSTFISIYVFVAGGAVVKSGTIWIVLIGALASEADTMMRLIYQKYRNTEIELMSKGVIADAGDVRTDHNKVGSFCVRIEMELGVASVVPIITLLGAILGFLDFVVFYCFVYYGGSCVVTVLMYVRKAIKKCAEWEKNSK